jgi:serine/threonine protein kinase
MSHLAFELRGLVFDAQRDFDVNAVIQGVEELITLKIRLWGLDRNDIWFEKASGKTKIYVGNSAHDGDPSKWWAMPEESPVSPSADIWALGYFLYFQKTNKMLPKRALKSQEYLDTLTEGSPMLKLNPSERRLPDFEKNNQQCIIL